MKIRINQVFVDVDEYIYKGDKRWKWFDYVQKKSQATVKVNRIKSGRDMAAMVKPEPIGGYHIYTRPTGK
jgi:hypothetical protein